MWALRVLHYLMWPMQAYWCSTERASRRRSPQGKMHWCWVTSGIYRAQCKDSVCVLAQSWELHVLQHVLKRIDHPRCLAARDEYSSERGDGHRPQNTTDRWNAWDNWQARAVEIGCGAKACLLLQQQCRDNSWLTARAGQRIFSFATLMICGRPLTTRAVISACTQERCLCVWWIWID